MFCLFSGVWLVGLGGLGSTYSGLLCLVWYCVGLVGCLCAYNIVGGLGYAVYWVYCLFYCDMVCFVVMIRNIWCVRW